MEMLKRFWIEDEGAEVGEWALFFALLALVAIAATNMLNPALGTAFQNLGNNLAQHTEDIYAE